MAVHGAQLVAACGCGASWRAGERGGRGGGGGGGGGGGRRSRCCCCCVMMVVVVMVVAGSSCGGAQLVESLLARALGLKFEWNITIWF